jgi:hypothetical protein
MVAIAVSHAQTLPGPQEADALRSVELRRLDAILFQVRWRGDVAGRLLSRLALKSRRRGQEVDREMKITPKQRREIRAQAFEEAAKLVPMNWCDPMLTGPKAVAVFKDGPTVERLLRAVRDRIRAEVRRLTGK